MALPRFALFALLAVSLVHPLAALGQGFPSKPLRLIVPYAPGGAVDTFARPTAQKMSESLGQPVIVENRPGGNATIGADFVAKSAPDGYAFVLTSMVHYMVPFFSKNVPYDTVKDFTPIAIVCTVPNVLAVHPSVPVNSVKELIEYGRKNPGKLYYGTTGIGSTHHLGGILFAQMAGIDLEHVPYKGGSPSINGVLAGEIPIAILTATTIMPHVRSGKLRALGVIEAHRSRGAPGVPTIGETVSGYAVPDLWFGALGPAHMPGPVVARLNAEFRKAVESPDVRARLEGFGFDVTSNTPEQFVATIKADVDLVRRVVTTAGIKPE